MYNPIVFLHNGSHIFAGGQSATAVLLASANSYMLNAHVKPIQNADAHWRTHTGGLATFSYPLIMSFKVVCVLLLLFFFADMREEVVCVLFFFSG